VRRRLGNAGFTSTLETIECRSPNWSSSDNSPSVRNVRPRKPGLRSKTTAIGSAAYWTVVARIAVNQVNQVALGAAKLYEHLIEISDRTRDCSVRNLVRVAACSSDQAYSFPTLEFVLPSDLT